MNAPEVFTASEIAEGLRWPKGQVYAALSREHMVTQIVRGKEAGAWAIADLPPLLFAELQRLKVLFNYRTVEDVLRNPTKRWEPPLPLTKLRPQDIGEARQLQEGLTNALALPATTSVADRVRIAARDFERAFPGRKISERQLRRYIERTIERDRGANEFHRWELYLSDSVREAPLQTVCKPVADSSFEELDTVLVGLENPSAPTETERDSLWNYACQWIEGEIENGQSEARAKTQIIDHLWRVAPVLAKNRDALARNVRRIWGRYHNQGLISSGRSERVRTEPPDFDFNFDLFWRYMAIKHGNGAQAWRELHEGTVPAGVPGFAAKTQFTPAFRNHFKFDIRRAKSRVPARILKAAQAKFRAVEKLRLGKKAARLRGPSTWRDYSDTAAYEFCSADDKTLDLWFYHPCANGDYISPDGWRFNVTRGQLLLLTDDRTDFPIHFELLPRGQYGANDIKRLLARAWMNPMWGVPSKGCNFEGGSWQALIVKELFVSDEDAAERTNYATPWGEIHKAFSRAGISLKLRRSRTPKAKTVERVFGSLDKQLNHLRGWIGNDPKAPFERVNAFLKSLKLVTEPRKAAVDPRKLLHSSFEIAEHIEAALKRFANEPQNGGRNPGASPHESFMELRGSRPAIVLPEDLRYLLATNRSIQKVSHEGIKLGKDSFYRNVHLGGLQGKTVEVYFDHLQPEEVIVIDREVDPRGLNPFAVPVCKRIPANTATRADFDASRASAKAYLTPGRELYRTFTPARTVTIKDENFGPAEIRETGARIEQEKTKARRKSSDREKDLSRNERDLANLLSELQADRSSGFEPSLP